ncbi:MAG: RNA methyltransferase PUA domain-containing protein, partial [Armatimonadota bacterium]
MTQRPGLELIIQHSQFIIPPMPPRLYLPTGSINPPSVTLPADAAHYLRVVLRLKPGDEFQAFDTGGCEY